MKDIIGVRATSRSHLRNVIFNAMTGWDYFEAKRTWGKEMFDTEHKITMKIIKSISAL
jgi:hypothetical protein